MLLKSLRDLKAKLWVFDCDGVLYDNKRIKKAIEEKMMQFISFHYRCSCEKAMVVGQNLLKRHKVAHLIRALMLEGFEEQEILEKTYLAVDFRSNGIMPSFKLKELLFYLGGKKIILSNNREVYAKKVVNYLEISPYFSDILGIKGTSPITKPDWRAFQFVQDATHIRDGIVFIDDKIENVKAAKKFGWESVWITDDNQSEDVLWIPRLG